MQVLRDREDKLAEINHISMGKYIGTNKRLVNFDIAKAICIILVVIGHYSPDLHLVGMHQITTLSTLSTCHCLCLPVGTFT